MRSKVKHGLAASAVILFVTSASGVIGLVGISFWGSLSLIAIGCLCLWGINTLHQ